MRALIYLICSLSAIAGPLQVPFKSQLLEGQSWSKKSRNCGQTSLLMVASYYNAFIPTDQGVRDIDDFIERKFGDSKRNYYGNYTGGSRIDRLTETASVLYGLTSATPLRYTTDDLKRELASNHPPIVGVWTNMTIDHTMQTSVPHWMVLTGMTATEVQVNDPGHSTQARGGIATYPLSKFLAAWQDQAYAVVMVYQNATSQAPSLTISGTSCSSPTSCAGPQNSGFIFQGSGFTPGGTVRRFSKEPSGVPIELSPLLSADNTGALFWSFSSSCSTAAGVFLITATDAATGRLSNGVTETITPGNCPVTGTATTNATLDGSPWSGPVNYAIAGPSGVISGSVVPSTNPNLSPGQYTITYSSGGPPNSTFFGSGPTATQNLLAGQTINFTLRFQSVANQPPKAGFTMISGPQTRTEGQTLNLSVPPGGSALVTCDASRSSDPDDAVVGWQWTLDGVSAGTTSIIARSLNAGTHAISLVVTDSRGAQSQPATGSVVVTSVASPPLISSISPSSVAAGTFDLTINGSNFDGGAVDQVYTPSGAFMGQGTIKSRTGTQIVVTESMTGTGPGSYTMKVKNSDGQLSNGVTLTVASGQPRIDSITPTSAVGGDLTLTINGSGFDPSMSGVQFYSPNGTFAGDGIVQSRSSTQIMARRDMSGNGPGNYLVKVRNPDGQSSNGATLVLLAQIVVTPSSGKAGTQFQYYGSGGFTANGSVTSYFRRPDGTQVRLVNFMAASNGRWPSQSLYTAGFASGTYQLWAVDESTGISSNVVSFTVQ